MIKPMPILNSGKDNIPENCVTYYTIGSSSNRRKHGNPLSCTNLSFSVTGDELLANISSDHIYLFDILNPEKPKIFQTDLVDVFGELKYDNEANINEEFSESSKKSESTIYQNSGQSSKANVDNQQIASTSKLEYDEDIEMKDAMEDKSRRLIDEINKEQKHNLTIYKAKSKLPKHISSMVKNATSFIKKEKYSDAIYLLNELINLMPNVSRFYCLRGSCLYKRKFNNDLYCALKGKPVFFCINKILKNLFLLSDFYKSLEIDPNNKESHLKLGSCLHDLGFYESAYQCLNYFKVNQSKDTRYKQFKELEQLIQSSLEKKPIEKKPKLGMRKMVEEFTREYFSLASTPSSSNNTTTATNASRSTLDLPSSSSSSSINSDFSTGTFRYDSEDDTSDMSDTSFDSDNPIGKYITNKKELEFRARSCDFKQRYLGHCNVNTDIMECNFFGSQYIIGGSDDGK